LNELDEALVTVTEDGESKLVDNEALKEESESNSHNKEIQLPSVSREIRF